MKKRFIILLVFMMMSVSAFGQPSDLTVEDIAVVRRIQNSLMPLPGTRSQTALIRQFRQIEQRFAEIVLQEALAGIGE